MSASAAFSQQERALEEQATIDEDVVLRSLVLGRKVPARPGTKYPGVMIKELRLNTD